MHTFHVPNEHQRRAEIDIVVLQFSKCHTLHVSIVDTIDFGGLHMFLVGVGSLNDLTIIVEKIAPRMPKTQRCEPLSIRGLEQGHQAVGRVLA